MASMGLSSLWGRDARLVARRRTTGSYGPRVHAMVALCTGASHLSKRAGQRVLEDLFGRAMRLGTMTNVEQATARALADPVTEAGSSPKPDSSK